jgi:hypothetical protein
MVIGRSGPTWVAVQLAIRGSIAIASQTPESEQRCR